MYPKIGLVREGEVKVDDYQGALPTGKLDKAKLVIRD